MKTFFLILLVALLFTQPVAAQTQEKLEVQQHIRNLTKQNFAWTNTAAAEPTDRIEMQIIATWTGPQATNNVLMRETLDQKLLYAGNLKLDGIPLAGNITTENINIGTLQSNESKMVTFEVVVGSSEVFAIGTSLIINSSTVFNTESADSVTSQLQVTRGGMPTDVSTGPISLWMVAGFLAAITTALLGFLFLGRYYAHARVLESKFETRTDRKLASAIDKIHQSER